MPDRFESSSGEPDFSDALLDQRLRQLNPLDDDEFIHRFEASFDPDIVAELTGTDRSSSTPRRAANTSQIRRVVDIDPGGGDPVMVPITDDRPSSVVDGAQRRPSLAFLVAAAFALLVLSVGVVVGFRPDEMRTSTQPADGEPYVVSSTTVDGNPEADDDTGNAAADTGVGDGSDSGVEVLDTAESVPPGTRDPLIQPFRWDSHWNMPLGDEALYVPAEMDSPWEGARVLEAIIVAEPESDPKPVYETTTAWGGQGPHRCLAVTDTTLDFSGSTRLPIPDDFVTEGLEYGDYPSHPGAIVGFDGRTVHQTQPFHTCADSRAVSITPHPQDDVFNGAGIGGSHGGPGISALGGTIRVADIESGRIPHAIKLTINAERYLSLDSGGYRWPAQGIHDYVNEPDGGGACKYAGTNPDFQLGTLLALPPSFDTNRLQTEMGRMLAQALSEYGGYVVDNPCRNAFGVVTEWGPDGRVTDEVMDRYGIDMNAEVTPSCDDGTPTCLYSQDVAEIAMELAIVANNSEQNPGGPGMRIAPCALPFPDGSGAPPADSSICMAPGD